MEDNYTDKPTYYSIIPASVRYSEKLSSSAKLFYSEITCLANKYGYCYATNGYFTKLYGVSDKTISRWVKELSAGKFIKSVVTTEEGNSRKIWILPDPHLLENTAKDAMPKLLKGTDKNISRVGTKMSVPTDKNVLYNTLTNTKQDKSEEQKKFTRTPKVKKEPSQADPNAKSESYWQNELTNNPEAVAKLRAWCADQSKEKIGQFLSVFNHSYSEKQLHSYCEHYAQILDIPIYKTHFSQLGEIFSCDLVQHILNKAKKEFEVKGSINIPLPKKEQVKRILPADDLFKF